MYRTFKTIPWIATACALAVTLACSNGTPGTPTAPAPAAGGQDANPDGSNLKVGAPTIVSPANDFRLDNRRPTLISVNTAGVFAHAALSYEFHLMNDAGVTLRSATLQSGIGTTIWSYPEELDRDTPYRWRVRATLEGRVGPWSSAGRFLTVRENRTPDPPPGQQLQRPPYGEGVIHQLAAQRPDLLARSCQEHGGTWEFMDLIVDTLRLLDTRWGYNGKRGNPADPSLDVINYHWGSGPDEGSSNVYSWDVILGHCGDNPGPAWIDLTNPFGAGAVWTSRGRF